MEAAHDNRRQLGQLMVDEGILTSDQLTQALAEQDRTGQPLGEILVELGFASPGAVANSLAEQHGGLLKTEYGVSAGLRTVSDAGDGIAHVEGLPSAMANELLEFEDGTLGLALNLDTRDIGVVILGDFSGIEEGQTVRRTGEVLSVSSQHP